LEVIKAKNISFTYPEQTQPVIKDISLSVKEGEFVVLFGESGSGKSTFLKLIKRELTPHGERTGEIYYKGEKIEDLDEYTSASQIGFVSQNPDFQIVTDKVWHELAFGLENLGEPTSVIRRRVGEMANFFGIHHWFHKKTTELSGGQKQLLNLASTIVMQPNVLILDEPTAQLDPIAAEEFIDMLYKLNRDLGLTIILVEHDLEKIFPMADRVVLLDNGEVLLEGASNTIGKKLKQKDDEHKMLQALPTVVRIFNELAKEDESPLTVRQGKQFLSEKFTNDLKRLKREKKNNEDNSSVLELNNVWFRYERDSPDVLSGASIKVKEGEIYTILGGNGSGKTTLLSVLSGQRKAYRGQVLIRGKKIKKYKNNDLYKHLLALLPQDVQSIFLKSSVEEDYKEISKVMNYTDKQFVDYVNDISQSLSIQHLLQKHPYDLSGGEQQKVALGKILLLKPKLILLDEPTKGMDAFSKLTLRDILLSLKKKGITIVLVTHDIEFAAQISDRCSLFFDGEIISEDDPVQFFSKNNFYTTAASRISRHRYDNAITAEDVIKICRLNDVKINE